VAADGSADTLMSLYVLRRLNLTEAQKDEWAATINSFQDAASGLFLAADFEPHYGPPVLHEHDHEHTTAFALAALSLIDRRPAHPLTLMLQLQANRSGWEPWLSNAAGYPSWDHRSAGVWASLAMTGGLDPAFSSFFFGWLDAHADPKSGFACANDMPYAGGVQIGWCASARSVSTTDQQHG